MDKTLLQGYDLIQQFLRTLRYNRERRRKIRIEITAEERSPQHATFYVLVDVSDGVLSYFDSLTGTGSGRIPRGIRKFSTQTNLITTIYLYIYDTVRCIRIGIVKAGHGVASS